MKFQRSLLLGAGLLLPSVLLAELVFEQDSLSIEADWSDERVSASFAFVNEGNTVVEIQNVRTSCGCTAAKPAQTRFEPGEKGSIEAEFEIGSRQGLQRNRIQVQTNEGTYHLNLAVDIPVSWTVDNRVLVWRAHEQGATKEARIEVKDPHIVSVELPEPNGSLWKMELREEDGAWILKATPEEFMPHQREAVRLRLQRQDDSDLSLNLFLRML